jgi:hypothetical protein
MQQRGVETCSILYIYHKWCITESVCWMIYRCLAFKSAKIIYIAKLPHNYHQLSSWARCAPPPPQQSKAGTKLISFVKNGWNSATAVCTWQNVICLAHWTNIPFPKEIQRTNVRVTGSIEPNRTYKRKLSWLNCQTL